MIDVNAYALPLGLLLKYLQKLNNYVLCRDRSHIIFQNCYLIKLSGSKVEEKATRFLALVAPEGGVVWHGPGRLVEVDIYFPEEVQVSSSPRKQMKEIIKSKVINE